VAFVIVALTSVAVPAVYVLRARNAPEAPALQAPRPASPPADTGPWTLPRPPVAFRFTGPGDAYGRLVTADLGSGSGDETVTTLRCDRLDLAGGHGICLTARRGVFTTYEALLFDASFQTRHTLPLSGVPSRTQASPDGRLGAMTVFESGHSYSSGQFSTRTSIVDLDSGEVIVPDLERFTVVHDGTAIQGVDFNFWGVTFTRDGTRF